MQFLFIGTGGSLGIPVVGCSCKVCKTEQRLRPSGLLTIEGKRFLLDAGPDLRMQALTHGIGRLDGVLLTHTHYDHIGGFDDLRPFLFKREEGVPILLSRETLEELKIRYHYLMEPRSNVGQNQKLLFNVLEEDFGETVFEGLTVRYLSYRQAGMKVTGYRFGNFAYVTDIQEYTDQVFDVLAGTETLVISALRWDRSPVHFGIDDAIAFAEKVGARNVYFTHITHDISKDERGLPDHVHLAADGLEIQV